MRRYLLVIALVVMAVPGVASAAPFGQFQSLTNDVYEAQLAVSPSGNAAYAWVDSLGGVWVTRRRPNQSWGAPEQVANDGDGAEVAAAIDDSGRAVVVWERTGPRLEWAVTNPGAGVAGSGNVGSTSLHGTAPSVRVTGSGHAWLAFHDTDDNSIRLAIMDLNGDTDFTVGGSGVNKTVAPDVNTRPRVVTNEAGDAAVLFIANPAASHYPLESVLIPQNTGALPDPTVVSAASAEVDGQFEAGLDDAGNLTAVWTEGSGSNRTAEANTTAIGSGSWPTPVQLGGALGDDGGSVALATGPNGSADAVVTSFADAEHISIFASRHTPSGWSSPRQLADNVEVPAFSGALALGDPSHGTTAVWAALDPLGRPLIHDATRGAGAADWGDVTTVPDSAGLFLIATASDASGHGQAAFFAVRGPLDSSYGAITFDPEPPTLTASGPATLAPGAAGAFSASAADAYSGLAGPVAWSFSDGATASGATASHAFAAPGAYVATASATDGVGNVTTKTLTVSVPAPPGQHVTPKLALGPSKAKVKKGKFAVTVTCTNEPSCTGTITVAVAGKKVASASFRAAAAKATKVTLKLSAKARKTLKRKHRLSATVIATATDPAGNRGSATRKLLLH